MSSTPPRGRRLRGSGVGPPQRINVGKRNAAVLAGLDNLDDWDEEELLRGQRRDRNGTFVGRPPKIVPKAVHDELVRRVMSKAQGLLRDNLVGAVEALTLLVDSPDVDDSVRLKAISMIMDRVMGKAPDKVEVTVQKSPFEEQMGKVFRKRVIDVQAKAS